MKKENKSIELVSHSIRQLDNGTVVKIEEANEVLVLNPVANAILNGLRNRENSPVSVSDLLEDIKRQFDVREISDDVLLADIRRTLDSFEENGLLRLSSGKK